MEATLPRLIAAEAADDGGVVVPLAQTPLGEPFRTFAGCRSPNLLGLKATRAAARAALGLYFCAELQALSFADRLRLGKVPPVVATVNLLLCTNLSKTTSNSFSGIPAP